MAETIWAGPPWLDLDERKPLLVSLRHEIDGCGLYLEEVRGGWRYGVLAQAADALAALKADEATADADDHWWLQDAVWRSGDGATVLLYGHDPDGNDIAFQGWGRDASACLQRLRAVLDSHDPERA